MIDLKEYERMVIADCADKVADWMENNQDFLINEGLVSNPNNSMDWLRSFVYVLRGRQ